MNKKNIPTRTELEQKIQELEKELDKKAPPGDQLKILALAIEQSSEGVAVVDLDGNLEYLNTAFAMMHGYSPDELIGKNLSIFHSPEQLASVDAANLQIKETGVFKGEIWHVRQDGTEFLTIMHNSLIKDTEGKPVGMIGTIRDITERKQAENKLKASEERFHSIFSNIPNIAVQGYDCDRKVTFWNKASEKLYGYSQDEAINNQLEDLIIPPEMKENIISMIQNWHENNVSIPNGELVLMKKDRSPVQVYSSHVMIEKSNGEKEMFCIDLDITERKQAEKIMLKASRMEATATLAGGIAHDFNNLMVGVLGYADLLRMQYDTEPGAMDMLNTIADSARKAGELAQQLLAFARGGKYQPKTMNLNDTVQETLRLNERSFPPRIRIERDIEPDLLNINADPTQMNQVVTNLCINAVEAIEKNGRIIITTRNIDIDAKFAALHPSLKAGRYVYISVEDTGCGMDKTTLSKVFEPFFSTKFQGRGLGLAAVYGIIKNHDGYISAYSEVGTGTAFKVYLPATESEAPPEQKPEITTPSGNETILVIDDEAVVLNTAMNILESFGYHVLLAVNGQEAVDIVQNFDGEIHLALLDMGMPILGGAETFPLIKKARPDIKVIICSGYELDAAAQALLDAGADAFVQKPFRMEKLAREIRKIFDNNKKEPGTGNS